MPDHVYFEYAPPRSWEHFEELCADLFQAMWSDPTLVRHGRAGQRQQGVDIVARQGSLYPVGLQCKRRSKWPVKRLTPAELDAEVEEALNFKPDLSMFYLLTTAEEDAKLQAHVRAINEIHKAQKRFEVVLLGWSEIVRRVTLQQDVAAKHFGAISGSRISPLLATWFTNGGKLELKGEDFDLAVQELALDLQDWPLGRVVVRQRESDALLQKVKAFDGNALSFKRRKERLALRKQLRSRVEDEQAVARGLTIMLTDPDLSVTLVKLWEDETSTFIRAFVEDLIDNNLFVKGNMSELHLWPPGIKRPEQRIKVHFPSKLYGDISSLMSRNRARWGKPLMDSVMELPPSLRAGYAVPAILRRIMRRLETGGTLDALKAEDWLSLALWQVEV